MFPLDQTARTQLLMILTIVNQHQPQYNKLLLLTTSTTTTISTTTMYSPLKLPTLTGTPSSTQMTQPTGTSSTTPMLPSLPLVTPTPSRLPVFPPVLIVAKPTPSSTHMTPPTRAGMSHPSNQCRRLLPQYTTTTTSTTTMPIPHRLLQDFSHLGNFLSTDLKLDSTLILNHKDCFLY